MNLLRWFPAPVAMFIALMVSTCGVRAQDWIPPDPIHCSGCRIRAVWKAGFSNGLRITTRSSRYRAPNVTMLGGIMGSRGICLSGGGCYELAPCMMMAVAILQNRSGGDLWFRAGPKYLQSRDRRWPRPDKDGWVRIPNEGAGVYIAGSFPVTCGASGRHHVDFFTRKNGSALAFRLDFSASCSPCPTKGV